MSIRTWLSSALSTVFGGVEEKEMSITVPVYQAGRAQLPNASYQTYAREGYMNNELVFACIEERSTSAAEPVIMSRTGNSAWKHTGPIIDLLNRPNPFMDRFELIATTIMHHDIAGNAYWYKVRSGSGRVVELWMLRPDRVRIVPSKTRYISHYEYHVGDGNVVELLADDVIHFKTRHPLDDWYGMPILQAISGRIDLDVYLRDFVKSSFESGGMPGAVLNVKAKVTQEDKDEIRRRFRGTFGGPGGWHEILILDNAEASFTPMTMQLGQRGLVVPEIDEINEARIPMVFGVPQSLIGTRTSYENGGYANKRAEATDFWQNTLIPLYKELAGAITLGLAPDFFGVTEVGFDMEDVWALREDMDKIADRWGKLAQYGIASLQEARVKVGLPSTWAPEAIFLVPSSALATPGPDLLNPPDPEPLALPEPRPSRNGSNP